MSNAITDDCSSGLHDYCTPCQCECHPNLETLQLKIHNQEEMIKNLQVNYTNLYVAFERLRKKLDLIKQTISTLEE